MSKVIHKFGPLYPWASVNFYGKPVFVGVKDEMGGEEIYLWTESEMDDPGWQFPKYQARIVGTGHPYESDDTYFGSIVMHYGLVWHILTRKVI